ncbi:MAG: YihY/virulence factor BrkB family protein [Bacteroidales bacterium]|nr:YihY/virulence factor BrkB family protein [Bacteroidales bacterium]
MKRKVSELFQAINKAFHFMQNDIWRIPLRELPRRKMFFIKQLRILILAVRGFREDQVLLRAPALTYYSLFSLVPVAALAFGIAKGFGLEMYLERQLESALAGRDEVYGWLMEITQSFLRGTHGGAMAAVGLIILIYTVNKLLTNIENSFNEIWQVRKSRTWQRKFSDYFAMMFIAPLFFIMASAATVYLNTQIQESDFILLNPLLQFLVKMIPYVLIWTIFTVLYMVMPNTNVKFSSALVAGIVAGTLFQLLQWGYINSQIGAARFGAIYGSFAALPLLLLWMHISWIIVLLGAELSFANQNVDNYEFETESRNLSPFNKKLLSLYVMQLLVKRFVQGLPPMSPEDVSHELHMPNSLVRMILNDLESVGLVVQIDGNKSKKSTYQPATDINNICIKTVLERLDHQGMDVIIAKPTPELDKLKHALSSLQIYVESSEENKLLKDL